MKIKLLTPICLLLFSFTMNGQTVTWDKSKKEAIYGNCLDKLRSFQMPEKKKKDICICYIETVQKTYTPVQFDNLLDEEIKRFKESSHCWPDEKMADNPNHKEKEPELKKVKLVGIWKFPHSWIYLNEDGTYLINYADSNRQNATGTWTVGEGKRSLEFKGVDTVVISHFEGHRFTYQTKDGQKGTALKVIRSLKDIVDTDLFGTWKDENSTIYFYNNKECILQINGQNQSLKWRLDTGSKQIKFSEKFPPMNLIDFDGLSFRYMQNGETYRYVRKLF